MGKYGPGEIGVLKTDTATSTLQTIDYAHHEAHAGSHYYVSGYSTLGSGGTISFSVTTPDTTKWAHMLFNIAGSDVTTVTVYEGATGISGGTAIVPINNNRNSSNTSGLTVTVNPTVTAGTVIIDSYLFGDTGGGNAASAGGIAFRGDELILKQNTAYLWRIVSGAADNRVSYRGHWYEHTNEV